MDDRQRHRSQPAALGQSAGGRQNDRAALPGSCGRCCSCAATTRCGDQGLLRRVRRADRADEEYCARHNGRNRNSDQGTSVCQDLPANYNAVLVVLEGEGSIGAEPKSVATGDVAWLTRGDSGKFSEVAIRATDKPLRALLYAGRPLHEAVVARGPFVMNTEAEIEQAYADYRTGASVRS